jgi:ubiquinone/menaquinone biosynthesis C-methylase UbiE
MANNTYTDSNPDPNIHTFNEPEVVDYYASLQRLTPCEKLLFDSYLERGMAILDLGVGGGRTTSYLSSIASRYVGIDYAEEMVAICRKRFPQLQFEVGNAADLSIFSSASFDAAVMAFNGLDYVIPDESRIRALREIRRVLKPGGIFIFSSHNPRSIWARPSWNQERVGAVAKNIVGGNSVFFRPLLKCLTAVRVVMAWVQALFRSLARIARRVPTQTFWRGHGYWRDPAHGGLDTHFSVPQKITEELLRFGFRLRRILGDGYPFASGQFATDWYYYVFQTESDGGEMTFADRPA